SARAAIPQLLSALSGIHDRRVTRTDRAQDFRTLARWFAECRDDGEAHRIFRAAFGLAPCRHLSVDAATLDAREQAPVPASSSWLSAPALLISPRLRATGRTTRPGRAHGVIDRTEAKQKLAQLAAENAARTAEAEARFATGTPFRLSSLGPLSRAELELLLDLLGEALGQLSAPGGPVESSSADGTLWVRLESPRGAEQAVLESEDGALCAPDFCLTVRPADAPAASRVVAG
ncbi:MAG: TIGR02677 family protein, partial [Myxococcaceae bacterium]